MGALKVCGGLWEAAGAVWSCGDCRGCEGLWEAVGSRGGAVGSCGGCGGLWEAVGGFGGLGAVGNCGGLWAGLREQKGEALLLAFSSPCLPDKS